VRRLRASFGEELGHEIALRCQLGHDASCLSSQLAATDEAHSFSIEPGHHPVTSLDAHGSSQLGRQHEAALITEADLEVDVG